jgi:hypothetical protein
VLLRTGADPAAAAAVLEAARSALAVVGSPADRAYADVELARAELALGRPAATVAIAEEALTELGADNRLERASALVVLAAGHVGLDQTDDAEAALTAAETELTGRVQSRSTAVAWGECADVWAWLGRPERERVALRHALAAAGMAGREWRPRVRGSWRP